MKTLTQDRIKWLKSLHLKKFRNAESCYYVEGIKMLEEAIKYAVEDIQFIITTQERSIIELQETFQIYYCTEKQMRQVSELKTPSAYIVVLRKRKCELPPKDKKFLVLDGIQDPGNFGTIIRTCDWFGVEHIVCSKDTVEQYNPKVIQATMGSIFRIHINYIELEDFIQKSEVKITGTDTKATSLFDAREILQETMGLVIGNEGNGIRPVLRKIISSQISIPKIGSAESLNAAVSAGIILSNWSVK
ncbi:MAG: RNA methyltransferase [Bacteroidetes bacterium]|nr:RNA methyltransferase [Bacteroidota bacterium]